MQFLQSVKKGNLDIIRGFIHINKNIINHVDNRYGRTGLMIASMNGNADIVKLLLANGAEVNHLDNDQRSALIWATMYKRVAVVRTLLSHGKKINVNAADRFGMTSLMIACKEGSIEIVKLLANADVNLVDKFGTSALMYACNQKRAEIVKILLEREAIPNATTNSGKTALMMASTNGYIDSVKLLLSPGINSDINHKDKLTGSTALLEASLHGHVGIVCALIDNGADIDLADQKGMTPLMNASSSGHIEIIRILIDADAGVNEVNTEGQTALIIASIKGRADIARALIDAGADIDIKDRSGRTALSIAGDSNKKQLIKLLQNASRQITLSINRRKNKIFNDPIYKSQSSHIKVVDAIDGTQQKRVVVEHILRGLKYDPLYTLLELLQGGPPANFDAEKWIKRKKSTHS